MSAPHRGIHLPFAEWPDEDRAAWEALFREGDILDGRGAACHWSAGTRRTNIQHYARWLGWLSGEGALDPDAAPGERVTREHVEAYARSILERCAPRTAASALIGLKCVIQRMDPEGDWRWLKDITNRLDSWAQPSVDRRAEILPPSELFHGAIQELERLAALQPLTRADAIAFRDVLIVALLITCPIRMRNLVQIEVGVHLRRVGGGYELHFADHETKTRQPLRYIIAPALVPWIDVYLEKIRPGFRIEHGCLRLWPGGKGSPLAYESLYARVLQTTQRLFGIAIPPHSFRSIAATALAEASAEDALHARALLGHRLPATTERYYVKATQLEAGRRVNAALEAARSAKTGAPR
jgi:integrase